MMRLTPVVKNLLILNIAFYIVVQLDVLYGASTYGGSQGYFGLYDLLSLHYPTSPRFKPVQITQGVGAHQALRLNGTAAKPLHSLCLLCRRPGAWTKA